MARPLISDWGPDPSNYDLMEFFQSWDQQLFHWINRDLANSFFDAFFPFITDLHKTQGFKFVFVPLVLILIVSLRRLNGALIVLGLALSLIVSDLIGSFGKHHVMRLRPFEAAIDAIQRSPAGGFSFPSNHAVNMFCAATFLSAFFPKLRWPFFTIAGLVGFSRIYNGVHFPIDVLGGALLGSLFGYLGAQLTKWIQQKIEARKKVHNG